MEAEVVERWQRMCLAVGGLLQLGLHLPDKAVAHLAQPLVGSQLGPVRLRHLEDRGHAEGAALGVQRGALVASFVAADPDAARRVGHVPYDRTEARLTQSWHGCLRRTPPSPPRCLHGSPPFPCPPCRARTRWRRITRTEERRVGKE